MIQYPRYRQHRFSSFQVIIAGFAAVGLVGALLLMLPIAAQQRCRVICSFEEDVFFLAKCLKDQSDIEIVTEKDYISNPKPNGYRSLHLTIRLPVFFAEKEIHVPVEIQLRTIAMDFWASLEHTIRYKKNLPINAEVETELKECADSSREWDGKMEHLLHIIT